MVNFIIRRLLYMVVTLFFISIISFILIDLPKGSYLETKIQQLRQMGGEVPDAQIKALEIRYGVHDPVYVKYWKWFSGVLHGDFGESFAYNQPVSSLIWGRLAFSFALSFTAAILSWGIAIPLGVYSATHRYTIPDYIITVLQFTGVAIPEFLLALVLMVIASSWLHQDVGGLVSRKFQDAPMSGAKLVDMLKHLWIPVVVISAGATAWLTRVMRGNLLDVLNMQYIQTARAKGLPERSVIWKHAVRNAMHPLVMALGGLLPALIGGEVIASIVLNLPTTGPLMANALINKDMYLAITFLMFLSVLLLIGNLLADLLLAWVDPRVRLE
ncbi:MAG TPA: ABC transporter permease [Herpetosiphonaceae bacterium]|nr:ABC transporter permease [Herpetosiphonaceae bacterium]